MAGNTIIVANTAIALGVTTKGVEEGVKKTRSILMKGLSGIGNFLMNPTVGINLGANLSSFFESYMKDAQDIGRFADLVGAKVDEMGQLATVASSYGADFEGLAEVLLDLSDKATDTSGALKELEAQGAINLSDGNGQLKSTLDLFYELSDVAKSMGPQEGVGMLKRIGINDARVLAMMMDDLIKEDGKTRMTLKGLVQQVGGGALYGEKDVEKARKLQNGMREIARIVKNTLVPAIRELIDHVLFLKDHWAELTPIVAALAYMIGLQLVPEVKKLWAVLGPLGMLFSVLAVLFLDFVQWANGRNSKIGGIWDALFGDKENAKEFLQTLAKYKTEIGAVLLTLGAAKSIVAVWGAITTACATGIASIKVFMNTLVALFGVVKAALIKLYALMAANPYVLAIAAIIAGIALLIVYWDEVREAGINALNFLAAKASEWGNALNSTIEGVKNWWNETIESLSIGWEAACNFWGMVFDKVFGTIIDTLSSIGDWFGFGNGDAKLAAGGAGNSTVSNNVEASQVNNINLYGDNSKEAIGNAVAGVTGNGLAAMVNSENHG